MIVYFFNQIGLGHTALRKFGAIFGMDTVHLRTFQEKEHSEGLGAFPHKNVLNVH